MEEYMEIPDATFMSDIALPRLHHSLQDPILGNFVIVYSREANNFSIVLSPHFDVKPLHGYIFESGWPY